VADAIRATTDKQAASIITADVLRAWFEELIRGYGEEEKIAEHFDMALADDEEDAGTTVAMHVRASSNAALHRALAKYMLHEDYYGFGTHRDAPIVNALAASLALDTTALEKAAVSEVKAETAAELKRLKAELKLSTEQKSLAANAPAAQAKRGGGAGQKTKAPLRAPAPRMSAEEAQLGIAAAMQHEEEAQGDCALGKPGADAQDKEVGHAALPDGADIATAAAGQQAEQIKRSDALLEDAVALVTSRQIVSVRLIKTELGVGTARAMKIIDELERDGVVSAVDQRGARDVLVLP
jgi:hypothetical protein